MKWSGSWIQAGFCSILWVLLVCMTHGSLTNKETNSNIGSRWHKRTPAKLGAEIKDDHSVYGSSLPVFSHDFKELFVSATLERSLKSVEDLHVAMILVGHRSIVDNFPFESINTDEKIMYMWSQAIKSWEPDRNLSTSHSDYYCIIQNNLSPNIRSKQAYSVPAYWMPTASIHDSDIQGNIGILRCRIKVFRREIEGWLRAQDDRALFIDVVRRSSSSLGKSHFNHTSIDPYDPSHLLVSFSLPWKTRFTGFGLNHDADTSKLQSWMRWKVSSSNEIKDNSYEISSSRNLRVSMCSGGIRPRNAFRADGSPMLLEFLQQAVRLGVHHVFLGVHLERFSPYLRHLVDHVRPFVDLNVVSISTLAGLNGYDDAPGILGVHLHPRYAEWIFLNQCLYFNKGLADYVAFWKPTDFVASYQAGSQGLMSPFQGDLSHLIYTIVHHYTVHHPLESNSSWLPSRSDSSAIANHALGSKSLSQRSASITTSLAITNTKYLPILYIPGNGVRDPDDSFGSWGPGNRQWTSDFFVKNSKMLPQLSFLRRMIIPTESIGIVTHNRSGLLNRFSHTWNPHVPEIVVKDAMMMIYEGIFDSSISLLDQNQLAIPLNLSVVQQQFQPLYEELRQLGKYPTLPIASSETTRDSPHDIKPLLPVDMKAPFWSPCDVEQLRDVVRRVFDID